ncbi:MAG TPA: phosphoribosyltransferase family protein [Candidatus Paceibacterota bacterium]
MTTKHLGMPSPEQLLENKFSIIKRLWERGDIRCEQNGKVFEIHLHNPILEDYKIRRDIASLFLSTINERYFYMGAPPVRIGLICISWAIAPIVGILGDQLECEIVEIAPSEGRIMYGTPKSGTDKLIILDDLIQSGHTITGAVHRLLNAGYQVAHIIALCDKEIGGRTVIERETASFAASRGIEPPKITAIIEKYFIMQALRTPAIQ